MLQINTCLLHSASSHSLILLVLTRSLNTPQIASKNSLSLCFRFKSLYLSNATFESSLTARSKRSRFSLKKMDIILTPKFFWQIIFFLYSHGLEIRWISASYRLPLFSHSEPKIFFSSLTLFSSGPLHRVPSQSYFKPSDWLPPFRTHFLYIIMRLGSGFLGPLVHSSCQCPLMLSFAMIVNWNWSLQCVQERSGSIVWFYQNAEIPRRFDSFDCATVNYSYGISGMIYVTICEMIDRWSISSIVGRYLIKFKGHNMSLHSILKNCHRNSAVFIAGYNCSPSFLVIIPGIFIRDFFRIFSIDRVIYKIYTRLILFWFT